MNAGSDLSVTLPADAALDGTVSDDGLPKRPGAVTTSWTVDSAPGPVTFANAGAVDTRASFSVAGTYVLRLSASDGAVTSSDTVQVAVRPAPPPGAAIVERRVVAANDDAEESAAGAMYLSSTDLELVYDGSNQTVGMRFANVTVPQGATVTRAYVQFETDETQSEATSLLVRGQAADTAAAFGSTSGDISGRPRTAASVAWSPSPWGLVGEAGANQRTPELAAVVQEIVNRRGWMSGNALALIVTGSGHRTARAYEGNPAGAPLLHIEYGSGAPQAPANTALPGISGTAAAGQTLSAAPGTWTGTPPIRYAYQWRRCTAVGSGCGDIVGAGSSTYVLAPADVGSTVRVAVTASNSVGTSTATSAQTPLVGAQGASAPVIAAAGDLCSATIGDCAGTADLLDRINPTAVLTLGDNAYADGTLAQYNAEYKPYWGRQDARVYPAPGNHEFHTANAQGYRDYFGARAPALWYSYDLGSWHIISLAGDIGVSAAAGSAQELFLKADLAAHPSQCTLAYWHEPRFSSGTQHGSDAGVSALWNDLYAAGAEIVLNGHEHNYERFGPQTPAAAASPAGIQEFVVGTGGANEGTYGFGSPIANSQVRNQGTPGVLKLTLRAGGYDWQFVPAAGFSFTDSGSGTCH